MKEEDIRPKKIFDTFLGLIQEDVSEIFNGCETQEMPCPACSSVSSPVVYEKDGFGISECTECLTLYVNPRPKFKYFKRFYSDSKSSRFWATTFYKETEGSRREQIWKPKAKQLNALLKQYDIQNVYDIGGGYGVFAEELEALDYASVTVIEPSLHLAKICRDKGFKVLESFLEDLKIDDFESLQTKCFVSFELFEHLYDPKAFLENLYYLMGSGDVFVFSTLSGLGVDIQTLGKHSKSISPPQHLNFLNPSSIKILLERIGFTLESVTTPGKLDLDIMKNNSEYINDNFWRKFLKTATEEQFDMMQKSISDSGFSSHMLVVCKKL